MQNNIAALIPGQLSERINTEYPLFVKFLNLYYEYANQRANSIGSLQNRHLDFDIDTTQDQYINEFYSVYAREFPNNTALNKKDIIKLLNDIYLAKGTEKSFKLLFKVLYNTDISISTPSEQILKASAGSWYQESFITVTTVQGDSSKLMEFPLKISNSTGDYYISPLRIVETEPNTFRIYYLSYIDVNIFVNDVLYVLDGDEIVYKAIVNPSLTGVQIVSGGLNFTVGQIYTILGTQSNTYVKIKEVNSVGTITNVELLQHGYDHADNLKVYISPFKAAPASNYSIDSVETPPGSGNFVHTVNFSDIIYNISENISCYSSTNTYFLELYADSYAGTKIFEYENSDDSDSAQGDILTDITMEEYIASKATLSLVYDGHTRTKGRFTSEAGQISNDRIKLQDNFYYQLFSYVINSDIDINLYQSTINKLVHPAGMKMFSSINKTDVIDLSADIGIRS